MSAVPATARPEQQAGALPGSGTVRNVAIVQNVTPNHHHAVYIDGFARHLVGSEYHPTVVLQATDEPLQFNDFPYQLKLVKGKYKSIAGQAEFARNLWPTLNMLRPLSIVHTMNPFGPLATSLAWRLAQKSSNRPKIIYDIRGLWVELGAQLRFLPPLLSGLIDSFDTRLANQADLVIAITPELKRILEKKGVPAHKIEVVPGGVDTKKFASAVPFDYANEWGWNGHVIGYVSSIGRGRNSDMLLRAFRRLLDKSNDPVYLVMIGPVRQPEYFEQLVSELGLRERVRFTGYIPHQELPSYVAGFELAVSVYPPGQQEFDRVRLPYKVIEYLGAGIPVLACNNVCHTTILKDGTDALIVQPDEEDIANGLALLLESKELRSRLRTHGQVTGQSYEFSRIAERITELYQRVLAA